MPLLAFIKRGSFLSSVGALLSASVVGQVILLAATPIITRLYAPEDFGLLALFTGILGASLVASSLRYELAIPLARSDRDAFALLSLALLLNGFVSVLLLIVVAVWGAAISQFFGAPGLVYVLWVLPAAVLGAGSYRAFRFWAVRQRDFGAIAKTKITQSLVLVISQIGAGLLGAGAFGLAAGHFLGQSAGGYRLARTLDKSLLKVQKRRQILRIFNLAKRYSRFPKFDVAASLVDTISVQLPNLLLAMLFNPAVAGSYLLADRVLGTPLSLLSQSIAQVIFSRSRGMVAAGRMAVMATKVVFGLAAVAVLPAIILIFVGEPLFALVFGEDWRQAGAFASWLVIGLFGQILFSSISLVLIATNAQNINLAVHFVMLCARSAALLYGYVSGNALFAIIALSLVNFVGYLAAAGVVIWHAHSHDISNTASSDDKRIV